MLRLRLFAFCETTSLSRQTAEFNPLNIKGNILRNDLKVLKYFQSHFLGINLKYLILIIDLQFPHPENLIFTKSESTSNMLLAHCNIFPQKG